jgi:hypothetical protein
MNGTITPTETEAPIRQWVKRLLNKSFPPGAVVQSNTNEEVFKEWTNMSHLELRMLWTNETQYRGGPITTTCNAFLDVLIRKLRQAGGLPTNKRFSSFMLPQNSPGWHWFPEPGRTPKAGDFFEIGKRNGMYKHVGVILEIDGILWTTVEAGQGGPSMGFDCIKRKGPNVFPSGLMGWLDIEEYFGNWNG